MSGIYIHIPFCKQACHYCNFHFSTSLQLKDDMIGAICKEIEIRQDYLVHKNLTSIYFGGGTPSLLSEGDFVKIFSTISRYFQWTSESEITLEANPDDLNKNKLIALRDLGINRLSIGIQSFFNEDLQWMNRAHNATEASECVKLAQDNGFNNISIDLIYGSPTTTNQMWEENIKKALKMEVSHISSYCLTVEEKTALHHQIVKKKIVAPDPERAAIQFDILINFLTDAGYDHYEISNFAMPENIAVHAAPRLLELGHRRFLDVLLLLCPLHAPHHRPGEISFRPLCNIHPINPLLDVLRFQGRHREIWIPVAETLQAVLVPAVGIWSLILLDPVDELIDQNNDRVVPGGFDARLRHQRMECESSLIFVGSEFDSFTTNRAEPRLTTLPEPRFRWTWHFALLPACDETRCRLKGLLPLSAAVTATGGFVSEFRIRTLTASPLFDVSPYSV